MLGVDPAHESQYLHIVCEFLKLPLPSPWVLVRLDPDILFENTVTKEVSHQHPGIAHYNSLVGKLKHSRKCTWARLKAFLQLPASRLLADKYSGGLVAFIPHNEKLLAKKRAEHERVFEDSLGPTHRIAMSNITDMERQIKKKKELNPLLVPASEKINSELLSRLSQLKVPLNS